MPIYVIFLGLEDSLKASWHSQPNNHVLNAIIQTTYHIEQNLTSTTTFNSACDILHDYLSNINMFNFPDMAVWEWLLSQS